MMGDGVARHKCRGRGDDGEGGGQGPSWRLIAVLASSFPLGEALARWLYQSAVELHGSGAETLRLAGDLGEGMLRDSRQEALIGVIGGRPSRPWSAARGAAARCASWSPRGPGARRRRGRARVAQDAQLRA